MSIAGGVHTALERAAAAGCDCAQIFVKNQRQWKADPLTDEQIALWQAARKTAGIEPIVAHANYLINLASPSAANWRRSVDTYTDELQRCEKLGLIGLVVHPGAHMGKGDAYGLSRIAEAIDRIHDRTNGFTSRTILETTAGQGSTLGWRFEQLAEIISRTREPKRVAVCVDTCHTFSAGYDLTTDEGYEAAVSQLANTVGLDPPARLTSRSPRSHRPARDRTIRLPPPGQRSPLLRYPDDS
jgi:deoxyribonuclease-4